MAEYADKILYHREPTGLEAAPTVGFDTDGAPLITDGRFVEDEEVLSAYLEVAGADLDEAIRTARTWPEYRRRSGGRGRTDRHGQGSRRGGAVCRAGQSGSPHRRDRRRVEDGLRNEERVAADDRVPRMWTTCRRRVSVLAGRGPDRYV